MCHAKFWVSEQQYCFLVIFYLIFIVVSHYHLVPLDPPAPSNHHIVVHASSFLFAPSPDPLTSTIPQAVICFPSVSLSPFG